MGSSTTVEAEAKEFGYTAKVWGRLLMGVRHSGGRVRA
jgi:hypothetical protein